MRARELAYCSIFGAGALLLPILFHAVHLGKVFMPMYLPLVALAFFVRPPAAMLTAFTVPLLSSIMTGMPPFSPPIALTMSLELATLGALIAGCPQRWRTTRLQVFGVLLLALLIGRLLYALLYYLLALLFGLAPAPIALLSMISGWPGILLMLVVIPWLVPVYMEITRK